ncbi:TonB-dependent receptor [Pedobacter sp. HMWF019]|uniref:TonB-dependent receptor n=1 Tax=Pedobacter sp. HMWF019 TaxID=2056856 RepID=UPI000D3CE539|nr:carboxypeptidase regulatory-like domain-containing protein [Pedobacter sp. HMWF019]PTT00479.1 TonB-dependent receptor [Pedobacter sp. HMWF019]
MKKLLFLFLSSCMVLLSGSLAFAQNETTASLNGTVADAKGPIPGATVIAIHEPSGSKYSTTTRADGRYNLPSMRIGGPYMVSVSFVGFKTQSERVEKLALGQNSTLNFKINEDSNTLTEVSITGVQGKVFNSGRTGASQNISRTAIQNLPTLNRSFTDFVKLTPQFSVQFGSPSFAGRSNVGNNFTIDGALFNNAFGLQGTIGSQTGSQPINMDAFEEISVNIAPYDIRQSGFTGAAINAVTRSGTNEFQGTLNSYYRNQDLVSEQNYAGLKTPVNNFSLKGYGFTLGGPIIKNKLFFFLSGELERRSDPGTSFVASRNGSTGPNVSQAKGEDLDKLSTFLQGLGYDPGPYENYPLKTRSNKLSAKLDYNIDDKNTLSLKYFYFRSFKDILPSNSGAPKSLRQPSQTGLPFQSAGYGINNNMDNVNLEFRTRFNNKMSNQLTIGFNNMNDFRESKGNKPFPLVDIMNADGGSYTAFGMEPFTAFNILKTKVYQVTDNFNIYAGRHEITLGANYEGYRTSNGFAPNYYGTYTFNSLADFYNSATNGVSNATKYQIQYSVMPDGSFPYATIQSNMYGLYVQDAYSVSDQLKLTAGLRADLTNISSGSVMRNENVEKLTFADGEKIDVSKYPKSAVLWSPRLGFNWNVNNEGKTQVRGGTGLFTGRPPLVWISNQASNNGVQFGSESINNPTDRPFTPNVDAYRNVNHATAANNTAYNLAVTQSNFKFMQVWRSNLAVDQKLSGGITGTLEALYSKDINSVYFRNVNLNTSDYKLLAGADNRPRYTGSRIYGSATPTPTNPNISDAIVMTNTNKGHSLSLTGTLSKEFKGGFFATAGYTYTDSRSVNDGGTIAQSMWRDRSVAGNPNTDEMSYSTYMVKNRFIASLAYRKEYINHLGTTVSMFYQLQDGLRYSYTYGNDLNNDGLSGNDLIYVPKDKSQIKLVAESAADTRTADQLWSQLDSYINQDPYLNKRRGQYAERNGLVGTMIGTLDIRIAQDLFANLGGKKNSLQFTFDIFNFGNMINKTWGVPKFANRANGLLNFKGLDANGQPTFSFPYLNAGSATPLVNTFSNSIDETARWRMQIGVKYKFN